MDAHTPVLKLNRVSRDVYMAERAQSALTRNEEGPRIILIFGWMEAKVSHTKKYMDSYAKLYPHASQILVQCRQSFFWTGRKGKEASLYPVIDLLRKEGMFQAPTPSILAHVFSNGGAFQMQELSRMLQSSGETPGTDPATDPAIAIIYDSVPGRWNLSSMLAAFLAPFRSTVSRMLIAIPLTIIYSLITAFSFITRERSSMDQMREALNKARVLPWTNERTPRLYIYSDTDELVQQEAVEEHIAEAKALGLNVRGEYFKGSAHVSHVRADADRYWAAVKKVWAEAADGT